MSKLKLAVFALFSIFLSSAICSAVEPECYKLKNGIPVFIKPNPESQMTAVYVVVKGGVEYLTPETSGLEQTVFTMMSMGSKKYSYDQLKAFGYETQGGFTSYCINDGSVYGMSCISKYFDQTFDRFQDSFFDPLFGQKEYELVVQDMQQAVASTMNDPSGMLGYYMHQIIYAGHPYEAKTSVTQDSIDNITLDAIKAHYRTLLDSRRISVVVSGNVESEKIVQRLNENFGTLGELKVPLKSGQIPEITVKGEPVVLCHQSASGGGHIMRAFKTPNVQDEDYAVARIVSSIYSDLLFNVVREKYGICYTPSSDITSSDAAFGVEVLYRVSNLKDFDSALDEARGMMEKGTLISGKDKNGEYITESIESRLEGYKNKYVNGKYMSQATVGGVCARMAASLLQFGDIDSADAITVKAKKCSAQDVRRVFKKYWIDESSQWFSVVGPEDEEALIEHFVSK